MKTNMKKNSIYLLTFCFLLFFSCYKGNTSYSEHSSFKGKWLINFGQKNGIEFYIDNEGTFKFEVRIDRVDYNIRGGVYDNGEVEADLSGVKDGKLYGNLYGDSGFGNWSAEEDMYMGMKNKVSGTWKIIKLK
jgi:hypothetical protein